MLLEVLMAVRRKAMRIIRHFLSKKYEIYFEPTRTFDLDRITSEKLPTLLFEGVEGRFLRCYVC